GTSLTVDSSGNYGSETNWNNQYGASGGGVSPYESKPSYQSALTQSSTHRTSPDVAYDGDPVTGFAVYDSYSGGGGWGQYGGTSAGAPQWAAFTAIANQGRSTPLSSSDTLNTLYSHLSSGNIIDTTYFHDVTTGGPPATPAVPGYDLATGLGSPKADVLIPSLRATTLSPIRLPAAASSSTLTNQPPAGSSPTRINPAVVALSAQISAQQLLPALINATYSSTAAASIAPAVHSPGVAPVVGVTAPVPANAIGANGNRVESGGGDNAPRIDGAIEGVDFWSLPDLPGDSKSPPRSMPLPPADSDDFDLPPPASDWQQVTTAIFSRDLLVQAGPQQRRAGNLVNQPVQQEMDLAFDPIAALAGLALALGTSWGDRQAEKEVSCKNRGFAG